MKLLYIAGPIRAENGRERVQNILTAVDATVRLTRLGFAVHCPHGLALFVEDVLPEPDGWLPADYELIKRSDALVLLPLWDLSEGTQSEVAEATRLEKPIFHYPSGEWQLAAWRDGKRFRCRDCGSEVDPWNLTRQGPYALNHRRLTGKTLAVCGHVDEMEETWTPPQAE